MTDRLIILAPALLGVAFMLATFAVYVVLCAMGRAPHVERVKHNEFFGPFLARYMLWLLSPVERALIGRVSANTVTLISLVLFAVAGGLIGVGRLATGAWIFLLGGVLDILDGRLARAATGPSPAGALVDSVADRWAELALFTGFAWYLHDTRWLFAVMIAIAGSMMVSYTRARGEGLGLHLRGGIMQRAERLVLLGAGTLLAAWFAQAPATASYAPVAVGLALLACGAGASITAVGRWIEGYRLLTSPPGPAKPAVVDLRVVDRRDGRDGPVPVPVPVPARRTTAVNQR